MKNLEIFNYVGYQSISESNKNIIRHISCPTSRKFIMTILVIMWCVTFAAYYGGILSFGISIAAHTALALMFFFTIAVFYDAEKNQISSFLKLRRGQR
jgi:hypothetical protein